MMIDDIRIHEAAAVELKGVVHAHASADKHRGCAVVFGPVEANPGLCIDPCV